MILTIATIRGKNWSKAFSWLLFVAYLLIFIIALRNYIIWQSVNLILGSLSLPFITTLDRSKSSKRFGAIAMIAIGLSCLVPVKTMLFISMLFCILFVVENFYGTINILPVLACLLLSPFFQYLASVFGFSIRITLTSISGELLKFFGDTVTVSGNMITSKGREFAVDPVCMGLNMMVTSLLIGIVLIGILEKNNKRKLRPFYVFEILTIIWVLNIVSNLIRIILLVRFSIFPDSSMHEIIGLICLAMYVCLPVIVLVKLFVTRYGTTVSGNSRAFYVPVYYGFHLLLLLLVTVVGLKVASRAAPSIEVPSSIPEIKDSKTSIVGENIFKIESPTGLIYVKPISNFYDAEHNPSICWKGSGYEMKKIKDERINIETIYTATLTKDTSILYTAWWFDNGEIFTGSQLKWRWKMFTGSKPFAVINITAATEEDLKKQVSTFLSGKLSRKILQRKKLKT